MSGPPPDDTRQSIIQSLFSRYDEQGTAEETLISFLKVYEDDGGDGQGPKTRYLMLAVTKLGKVLIHKAKRNSNLTFSKGKTWNLEDVRAVEVMGPTDFALTMTIRRYHWTTDRPKDQTNFLNAVVKVYRTYTKGQQPELINFQALDSSRGPISPTDGPGPRNGSISSPPPMPNDLRPPNLTAHAIKSQRSGSSSSMNSALGSSYGSESAFSPNGRRLDRLESVDERSGSPTGLGGPSSNFGRSPLADSSIPPAIRMSGSGSAGGGGIGERRPSGISNNSRSNSGNMVREAGSSGSGKGTPIEGSGSGRVTPNAGPSRPGIPRDNSETSNYGLSQKPSRERLGLTPNGSKSVDRPLRPNRSLKRDSKSPSGSRSQTPQPSETPFPSSSHQPNLSIQTPTITHTEASPSIPPSSTLLSPTGPSGNSPTNVRPRRASFHPPPLNTAFSREVLLTSKTGILPGAGMMIDDGQVKEDAIMASVEEMLEGFDWTAAASSGEGGVKKRGADAIEGRLLDELTALDSANIHAFLESDDRIAQVLQHMDEALNELEDIDAQLTGYRMQLQAVTEDISFIESQNRGLQVQTSNQQALLDELRQLLQIAEVPPDELRILVQESPSSAKGVQTLERALASLYKALHAGMDSANAEVQATIHRLREYQESSSQFCKRLFDYLEMTFKYQSDQTLSDARKSNRSGLAAHTSLGEYLMMYEGLVLYMKEMDEERYQKLCSGYFSTISDLHQSEMKDLLMSFMGQINAVATGEPNEASFATSAASIVPKASTLQKGRAVIGFGKDGNREQAGVSREGKGDPSALKVGELYSSAITEIVNAIITEEDFINAFLHLTDTESTFADHMELDSYFRRQAARHATGGLSKGMVQLVRSMMDLVFGFVSQEVGQWIEAGVDRNPIAIVGVIAVTERLAKEAEEENTSIFFSQMFDRLLVKQHGMLDAFINEQVKIIDQSKINIKRRRGVVFYIRHFPIFVERMEAQLYGSDDLSIRRKIDDAYDKILNAVFGSLSHMAKTDKGEGQAAEDKGQLNYHVIMIENMYHFLEDMRSLDVPALGMFMERARGLYEENLNGYSKLLIRRSFGRLMDFFDGVERLLNTGTPVTEIHLHSTFSRSALKKILRDFSIKDMKKSVEGMSKRVDKHFTDDDPSLLNDPSVLSLVNAVWSEVTKDLKKETARDDGIIRKGYAEGGLELEFGAGDVENACKRMRGQ